MKTASKPRVTMMGLVEDIARRAVESGKAYPGVSFSSERGGDNNSAMCWISGKQRAFIVTLMHREGLGDLVRRSGSQWVHAGIFGFSLGRVERNGACLLEWSDESRTLLPK